MKKLIIYRYKEFNDATLGRFELISDGKKVLMGYSLEPAGPDTIEPNKDKRIPVGIYDAVWSASSQTGVDIKGKLPLVFNENVSKDRLIRIHIGNTGKDTLGCILLGMNTTGTAQILKSRAAMTKFCNLVFPDDFIVEIKHDNL